MKNKFRISARHILLLIIYLQFFFVEKAVIFYFTQSRPQMFVTKAGLMLVLPTLELAAKGVIPPCKNVFNIIRFTPPPSPSENSLHVPCLCYRPHRVF